MKKAGLQPRAEFLIAFGVGIGGEKTVVNWGHSHQGEGGKNNYWAFCV